MKTGAVSTTFCYPLTPTGHSLIGMAQSVIRLGGAKGSLNQVLGRVNERLAAAGRRARMADEDSTPQGDDESREVHQPQIQMELVGSLPGGRAIAGVEQEGSLVLLASREHISEQASGELVDVFRRIVSEGWWPQGWPAVN